MSGGRVLLVMPAFAALPDGTEVTRHILAPDWSEPAALCGAQPAGPWEQEDIDKPATCPDCLDHLAATHVKDPTP